MKDRKAAAVVDKTKPIQSFGFYYEKYTKEGFTGEAFWKRIIEGSETPNEDVNQQFGIKKGN